jgi:Spy/CpxP family protein refolding chaperone
MIMNIVRKLLPVLASCLVASSLGAQPGRATPRPTPAMWAALQLTESQQVRVDAIHDRYAPAVKLARKQASDSAARIVEREMVEVRSLLTPSQQQIFDSYMSGKRAKRRGVGARLMPVRIAIPR